MVLKNCKKRLVKKSKFDWIKHHRSKLFWAKKYIYEVETSRITNCRSKRKYNKQKQWKLHTAKTSEMWQLNRQNMSRQMRRRQFFWNGVFPFEKQNRSWSHLNPGRLTSQAYSVPPDLVCRRRLEIWIHYEPRYQVILFKTVLTRKTSIFGFDNAC